MVEGGLSSPSKGHIFGLKALGYRKRDSDSAQTLHPGVWFRVEGLRVSSGSGGGRFWVRILHWASNFGFRVAVASG